MSDLGGDLTSEAQNAIASIAASYGLSHGAVEAMARAVAQGGGTMAQFDIPELGGSGQWMAGGMIMVGDMFNHGLQAKVGSLCAEIAEAQARAPFFRAPTIQGGGGAAWWPAELGAPASSGGQNAMRYAYFPQVRRLAVSPGDGRAVIVLDTLDHQIGGFSQQQQGMGGDPLGSVAFSSQFGQYALSSLPLAPEFAPPQPTPPPAPPEPAPAPARAPVEPAPTPPAAAPAESASAPADAEAILATIERLAALRDAGALTEAEFAAKKTELLARL
ncbi:MAG: SHOCT domain-containing protein [Pseudomonadota bacterium]